MQITAFVTPNSTGGHTVPTHATVVCRGALIVPSVHLFGGGWDPSAAPALYGPFLEAAGGRPTVAAVVLDEGDGEQQFRRWDDVLRRIAPCEPVPVLVPLGGRLDVAALGDADGLLVCGGLTPAYADALAPVAAGVRRWLADRDRPYAGFSAGAAVAAGRALVGGWRSAGVPVCPEDAAEDLDEVSIVSGLGLVPWTVDVHCAQWGTLPRLLTGLAAGAEGDGLALDEDTAVHVTADGARVAGRGTAWRLRRESTSTTVTALRDGDRVA
jgi:cyanophycinase